MCQLVPRAESVTKLTSVCSVCSAEASFTKRLSHVEDDAVELIGGTESYIPVCRGCDLRDDAGYHPNDGAAPENGCEAPTKRAPLPSSVPRTPSHASSPSSSSASSASSASPGSMPIDAGKPLDACSRLPPHTPRGGGFTAEALNKKLSFSGSSSPGGSGGTPHGAPRKIAIYPHNTVLVGKSVNRINSMEEEHPQEQQHRKPNQSPSPQACKALGAGRD